MRRASRPFKCEIAGRTVEISLRHGGGVQEPEAPYVRCDERDCQYVDLNESPCPLRVDMFADGSERRVAEHLAANAGVRFCFACLTEELGITHEQVRRASWGLKETPGGSIRPARCAKCRRRRVTIDLARDGPAIALPAPAVPSPDPSVTTSGKLASYLRARPGYGFCVHCLARDLRMPVDPMRDAMSALERSEAFPARTSQCVNCLLTKRVIRYEKPSGEDEIQRRVIEFITKSVGQAFCPSCVAFATDIALADVKRLLPALAPVVESTRHEALCSACGRWLRLIGTGVRT